MKLEFDAPLATARTLDHPSAIQSAFCVRGETDRLSRVLMCAPHHLQPVPCCSVTEESLRAGFSADAKAALDQHANLRNALTNNGVEVDLLPPVPGLPDLSFARDVAVTTPWGLVVLNPALGHRSAEVAHIKAWARAAIREPVEQITQGTIEGGDVCIARPGLLILGVSGERTTRQGAEAFAARFRADGWEVVLYPFDPHFLHLDTILTMLTPNLALGCVEVLDDSFIADLAARGIDLIPVTYKEARRLGCNVVSVDGNTIIAGASTPRVTTLMRKAGFSVTEVELGQFQACGGGVHCLTMPLVRG